jgi:hypothetical protein
MKKFKWWETLVLVLLTPLFITTFFGIAIATVSTANNNTIFFIIGTICAIINIACFFGTIKIIQNHYNYQERHAIKRYYVVMIIMPLVTGVYFMIFEKGWMYLGVYALIVGIYAYIIEKEFGKFTIKINKEHDELLVGDVNSFNTELTVQGKNKKPKGSTEKLLVGDIIQIQKDDETILTLHVIKNQKSRK